MVRILNAHHQDRQKIRLPCDLSSPLITPALTPLVGKRAVDDKHLYLRKEQQTSMMGCGCNYTTCIARPCGREQNASCVDVEVVNMYEGVKHRADPGLRQP